MTFSVPDNSNSLSTLTMTRVPDDEDGSGGFVIRGGEDHGNFPGFPGLQQQTQDTLSHHVVLASLHNDIKEINKGYRQWKLPAQKQGFTLGGEASKVNSEVLMLTARGLMLNLQKKKKNQESAVAAAKFTHAKSENKPFGEEVQRLQRSRVQGENTDLHRHHRRGGVLQHERLHLKQRTHFY